MRATLALLLQALLAANALSTAAAWGPADGPMAQARLACDDPALPRVPHAAIVVLGDAGFLLPTSGVVGGSGTAHAPYLICGWDIQPTVADGIYLIDTTAHVSIRGNDIHDALATVKALPTDGPLPTIDRSVHAGIHLQNATHASIEANRVQGMEPHVVAHVNGLIAYNADGIAIVSSSAVVVQGNDVSATTGWGIWVYRSDDVTVEANDVWDTGLLAGGPFRATGGLAAASSGVVRLAANRVSGNPHYASISVSGSSQAEVEGNQVNATGPEGIRVWNADGTLVRGNRVAGSGRALANFGSDQVDARGNDWLPGQAVWTDSHAVDARESWWGCAEGPGAPGCASAAEGVLVDPWSATPTTWFSMAPVDTDLKKEQQA